MCGPKVDYWHLPIILQSFASFRLLRKCVDWNPAASGRSSIWVIRSDIGRGSWWQQESFDQGTGGARIDKTDRSIVGQSWGTAFRRSPQSVTVRLVKFEDDTCPCRRKPQTVDSDAALFPLSVYLGRVKLAPAPRKAAGRKNETRLSLHIWAN